MYGILHYKRHEYTDGIKAIREITFYFIGIPVLTASISSTNNKAIQQLTTECKTKINIKGYV